MIRWRSGTVVSFVGEWPGVREVEVEVPGDGRISALAYPALVGAPEVGERVLLNTTALALGLGTGGHALVVAIPDRLPPDPSGPGHLVKARYTPRQATVLGVDDQQSPHHDVIAAATSLDGMPVVVADLHSALPAIVAGILADLPPARIAYVLTDGGALPIWYSRTVAALTPLLCGTVTTGQAFGGDLESVTVHTGLLAARHVLDADVAIVTQGPGNLGHRHAVGFLRGRRRRGRQRRGRARWPAGRCVAALRRRSARAAPRRFAPCADRVRPGRARSPPTWSSRRACRRSWPPRWNTTSNRSPRATGSSTSRSTDSTARFEPCRCGCRRWAARSTRMRPISWRRPRRGGTQQR